MKLPIEKQAASPFNQMIELGVPTRIAKAVSEMLLASEVKTASEAVLVESVKNASSMLCADIGETLKIAGYSTPGLAMSEEDEEEEGLRLATNTVKLAYAVARNAGASKEKAAMMAMHAHTRLLLPQAGLQKKVASKAIARAFTEYYADSWPILAKYNKRMPNARKAALNDMRLGIGNISVTLDNVTEASSPGSEVAVTLDSDYALEIILQVGWLADFTVEGVLGPIWDRRTIYHRLYRKFEQGWMKAEQGNEDYKALRNIRNRFAAALKKPDAVPALFKSKAVNAFRGRLWEKVAQSKDFQEMDQNGFVIDQSYSGGEWQWLVESNIDFAPKPREVVVEGFKQSGTGVAEANVNIEFRLEWEDWNMNVSDYSGATL